MEKLKLTSSARARSRAATFVGDLIKLAVMLAFVFPFYWMVITAFKPYVESMDVPPALWPQTWTLEGFRSTFSAGLDIPHFMLNTVVVTAAVICLQLAVMVPAAYAFAKRKFPLSGLAFGVVLVAFMIPQQLTYIPIYLMMSRAKLISSLLAADSARWARTPSASSCCASPLSRFPTRSWNPPSWTVRARSRSCCRSCCPCANPRWSPSPCSPSSAHGIPTSGRWS